MQSDIKEVRRPAELPFELITAKRSSVNYLTNRNVRDSEAFRFSSVRAFVYDDDNIIITVRPAVFLRMFNYFFLRWLRTTTIRFREPVE